MRHRLFKWSGTWCVSLAVVEVEADQKSAASNEEAGAGKPNPVIKDSSSQDIRHGIEECLMPRTELLSSRANPSGTLSRDDNGLRQYTMPSERVHVDIGRVLADRDNGLTATRVAQKSEAATQPKESEMRRCPLSGTRATSCIVLGSRELKLNLDWMHRSIHEQPEWRPAPSSKSIDAGVLRYDPSWQRVRSSIGRRLMLRPDVKRDWKDILQNSLPVGHREIKRQMGSDILVARLRVAMMVQGGSGTKRNDATRRQDFESIPAASIAAIIRRSEPVMRSCPNRQNKTSSTGRASRWRVRRRHKSNEYASADGIGLATPPRWQWKCRVRRDGMVVGQGRIGRV
ncbi:hypothetical protein BDZ89DRAFT_1047494 [Hymenopellis radicata]|nr:hypothetical protein BDZ89DRAFT_1047494 [Hymenopellis radicata]